MIIDRNQWQQFCNGIVGYPAKLLSDMGCRRVIKTYECIVPISVFIFFTTHDPVFARIYSVYLEKVACLQGAQQLLDLLSECKYPRLVQVPSKDGNTNLVYIYPIYHVSRYSKDKDTYLINIISHDAFIKRINDIIGEIQPGGGVYIFEKGSGEMRFKYTQDNEMYQLAADALKGKLTHKDKGIYIITSEQTGLDFVMLVSHEEIMAQIRKYNMSNNFILRYYSGRYMP